MPNAQIKQKPRPVDEALELRAVVYLRVSTNKQADKDIDPEGFSLPAQRDACYRRATELGAEVVDEYIDRGESAKTTDRPSFLRMVNRIQTDRDVDFVILDKVNRFARNRRDDANVLFELRKAGCKLISVKENIDETPAGTLMHGILATIAEYESRNNGAEALKGMTRKAQVGGTPGRAPVGYINVTRMIEFRPVKVVEIDQERAPHVRWAFESYATGQWTLTTLTQALAERGLMALPRRGKPPRPISRAMVGHMLRNRYYIKFVSFNGSEFPGRHDPLISEALFDRVQQQLDTAAGAGEKRRIHHHYLKGTLYCESCRNRLCYSQPKGHGGTYRYFYCIGRQMKRAQCLQCHVPVDVLEDEVLGVFESRITHLAPKNRQIILDGVRNEVERWHEKAGPALAMAEKRVGQLEDERRRLARGVVDGSIPGDLAKAEQERIRGELVAANRTLAKAETEYPGLAWMLERALEVAERCADIYRAGGPHIRRVLNQAFFKMILVRARTIEDFELNEPWSTLFDPAFGSAMVRNAQNPGDPLRVRGSRMFDLAPPAGLEPATHGLGNRRSIL